MVPLRASDVPPLVHGLAALETLSGTPPRSLVAPARLWGVQVTWRGVTIAGAQCSYLTDWIATSGAGVRLREIVAKVCKAVGCANARVLTGWSLAATMFASLCLKFLFGISHALRWAGPHSHSAPSYPAHISHHSDYGATSLP